MKPFSICLCFLLIFVYSSLAQFQIQPSFVGLHLADCHFSICDDLCPERDFNFSLTTLKLHRAPDCKCDKLCPVFGDCCWNYFAKCENLYNRQVLLHLKRVKTIFLREDMRIGRKFKAYGVCTTAQNEQDRGIGEFYTIGKCLSDYDDLEIKNKCEDKYLADLLNFPVSHKRSPREVYKNVYCALCHRVRLVDIVFWKASLKCVSHVQGPLSLSELGQDLQVGCHIRIDVQANAVYSLRSCVILPRNCDEAQDLSPYTSPPLNAEDLKLICESYLFHHLDSDRNVIANPHCALCNEPPSSQFFNDSLQNPFFCQLTNSFQSAMEMTSYNVYDINVSSENVTVTLTGPVSHLEIEAVRCSQNERYNYIVDRCEPIPCPERFHLVNISCELIQQSDLKHDGKDITHRVVITLESPMAYLNDFLQKANDRIINMLHDVALDDGMDPIGVTTIASASTQMANSNTTNGTYIWEHTITLMVTSENNYSDSISLLDVLYRKLNIDAIPGFQFINMRSTNYDPAQSFVCKNGSATTLRTQPFYRNDIMVYTYIEDTNSYLDLETTPSTLLWTSDTNNISLESVIICGCLTFELKKSDFDQLDNETLLIGPTNFLGEFRIDMPTQKVYVCVKTLINAMKELAANTNKPFSFQNRHLASAGVSLLCSLMATVIMICYKQYSKVFHKLRLALIFMLALADGLDFICLVKIDIIRKVAAAVLHFVWLEAFIIMTLISVELYQNFDSNKKQKSNRKIVLGATLGSVVNVVVIATTLALDHSAYTHLQIGYGEGLPLWWAFESLPMIVFVLAPICLILSFSATLSTSFAYKAMHVESHCSSFQQYIKVEYVALALIQTTVSADRLLKILSVASTSVASVAYAFNILIGSGLLISTMVTGHLAQSEYEVSFRKEEDNSKINDEGEMPSTNY